MIFGYELYYDYCFIGPIRGLCWFSLFVVEAIISIIVQVCRKNFKDKDIALLVMTINYFIAMSTYIGQLSYGGIHLFKEKENHAIELVGEISEIQAVDRSCMPYIKHQYDSAGSPGVQFTISGVQCSAPTNGDLKVGDYVKVLYLPQSGYILSIELESPGVP